MSSGLARVRARYEATPRKTDDELLDRIARGDRGCLGDLLSGLGALTLIVTMALGAMGLIAWSWAYVGVGLWVGGFFLGTLSQARSGRLRKAALESGPLVIASVLRCDEWLRRPGKRAGRAVVLFTTDPARRFDREWLDKVAKHVERRLSEPSGGNERVPLRALLGDPETFGVHLVPSDLLPEDESGSSIDVYLASAMIHPERLEGAYLGAEEDAEADRAGLSIDAPTRPPAVVLFVDPSRGFVEQVPRLERAGEPEREPDDDG